MEEKIPMTQIAFICDCGNKYYYPLGMGGILKIKCSGCWREFEILRKK